MKKIILSLLTAASLLSADASFAPEGTLTVNWKAFKTPAKIGVGGTFDKVALTTTAKTAPKLETLLVGASAQIDTTTVNSKNEGRDKKLVAAFFQLMSADKITAKIIDAKAKTATEGSLNAKISMNGITKTVPMHYSYANSSIQADGVIDLFDFNASKSLSSITKACYALHKGKTWNDVTISFKMPLKETK